MWRSFIQGSRASGGFALPTVLIASTVMLVIMGSTLSSVSATVLVSLETSHYTQYAKNAAQSGMAMAKACLQQNNYEPQWTNAAPLRPNTNCSGVVQSGVSEYIHESTDFSSTFTVPGATTISNGVQRITVDATAERVGAVSGEVYRSYNDAAYATISAQATFNSVGFGYVSTSGAFFGVIDPLGQVSTVGYNANGQLGNGSTTNATAPQVFSLPAGLQTTQLFTSQLSEANALFALTTDGQLYGAGGNGSGQLGNGATASTQSTPVRFQLPAGVEARFVAVAQQNTFVIGNDNNVYSAGNCGYGFLGYTYTISGCSNRNTYQRVALPAANLGDLNTLPVANSDWVQYTNMVVDRRTAYLRMQGGRVYAWGLNDLGQLGNGNRTDSSTPIQITTLGNSGQPTATQVAFDGDSVWILDSNGEVWATGNNGRAALGTSTPIISGSGKCLDIPGASTTNGTRVTIYDCNDTVAQQIEWAQDGTLRYRPNASTVKCITNLNGTNSNGNQIQINNCTGGASQVWYMANNGAIINTTTNKCLDNPSNATANGTFMQLYDCLGNSSQTWTLGTRITPQKVVLPTGQGTVVRITTDQFATLFLMSNGTVWGYGFNTSGQLGNGGNRRYNPAITQYILPAGRTAVDLYTAKAGTDGQTQYANTYVILDNGTVYGSGSNAFGQLGNGTTAATVLTPVQMQLPAGVVAQTIQTGFGTAVILTDEGKIYTVGNNANGQLGDGSTTNSSLPSARQYVNTRPVVLY